MRSLMKRAKGLWEMFFGKQEEKEQKLGEAPPLASPIARKADVREPLPPRVRQQAHLQSPTIVSKRRRKQKEKSMADTPVPPPQEARPVINRVKDLYPLLAIDELVPKKWDKQRVTCFKEMLCWFWNMEAIGEGYFPLHSLKSSVLARGFGLEDFTVCFDWLDRFGLIIWHKRRALISLRIKLDNPNTKGLVTAIQRGFRAMDKAVQG